MAVVASRPGFWPLGLPRLRVRPIVVARSGSLMELTEKVIAAVLLLGSTQLPPD